MPWHNHNHLQQDERTAGANARFCIQIGKRSQLRGWVLPPTVLNLVFTLSTEDSWFLIEMSKPKQQLNAKTFS